MASTATETSAELTHQSLHTRLVRHTYPNQLTRPNQHTHLNRKATTKHSGRLLDNLRDGQGQFSYHDETRDHSATGDEITVERGPLGTLVTITLETIPDLHTLTVTLILPDLGGLPTSASMALMATGRRR